MAEMRKVLVVDDEEIVRLSHMRTLAGQSCDVEAARGGEEALEKMRNARRTWFYWICACREWTGWRP